MLPMTISIRLLLGLTFLSFLACKQQEPKATLGQKSKIAPAPPLLVLNPDTPEEEKALAKPFKGVTADGIIQQGLFPIKVTGVSTLPIQNAVTDFLGSISEEQRKNCVFPVDSEEWRRWSNIDFYLRKGIGLPEMSERQKALAFKILETGLSASGFEKSLNIMKMEGYLARLANDFEKLGPELYWFSFMGTPSEIEPWGWQIDGHHLVINYFIMGDQIVMTPTFMGSEPNYIEDGENKGTRTFKNEEELGYQLYTSLSEEQKNRATSVTTKEYNYNQAESYSDNAVVPFAGISSDGLTGEQQAMLQLLIKEYVGNMTEDQAIIKMREVMTHWSDTYFAWVGGSSKDSPFYYRVQSPIILIEFDHQKPVFLPGNKPTKKHIHTVVRTPNGNDYGKDLLRQHLEEHHH